MGSLGNHLQAGSSAPENLPPKIVSRNPSQTYRRDCGLPLFWASYEKSCPSSRVPVASSRRCGACHWRAACPLAQAESGRIKLNPAEQRSLDSYYSARLKMVLEDEGASVLSAVEQLQD